MEILGSRKFSLKRPLCRVLIHCPLPFLLPPALCPLPSTNTFASTHTFIDGEHLWTWTVYTK